MSAKLVTAKIRSDQNIENVPVGVGTDELDAIRSGIAFAHMLFERDLISDNLYDAVVFGDLLGVSHPHILSPARLNTAAEAGRSRA